MQKVNMKDIERMNEYFKDSGLRYDNTDQILKSENAKEVAEYLFETDLQEMLYVMDKIVHIEEGDTMLETLMNEINYVWNDYENGMYYVIVQ